jgi:hypothetical protein
VSSVPPCDIFCCGNVDDVRYPDAMQMVAPRCARKSPMCRNIKVLDNFEPPASDDEIRASALQFVRKLSGTSKPSKLNEEAFNRAVEEVTAAAARLISSLEIHAPPRDREEEMRKAKERSRKRFA